MTSAQEENEKLDEEYLEIRNKMEHAFHALSMWLLEIHQKKKLRNMEYNTATRRLQHVEQYILHGLEVGRHRSTPKEILEKIKKQIKEAEASEVKWAEKKAQIKKKYDSLVIDYKKSECLKGMG